MVCEYFTTATETSYYRNVLFFDIARGVYVVVLLAYDAGKLRNGAIVHTLRICARARDLDLFLLVYHLRSILSHKSNPFYLVYSCIQ